MRKGFPPDIRQELRRLALYTGIIWQCDGEPGIIIKLPANLTLPPVSVSIDTVDRESSSTFSLTVQLQQKGRRTIPVACRFSQRNPAVTHIVQALLAATQLEVYAISPQLAFLGTQQLPWPPGMRQQLAQLAHDLLPSHVLKASPGSIPALHITYQRTLQRLHHEELAAITRQKGTAPSKTSATVPLVQSIHTFEEQNLAAAHHLDITETQARQFVTCLTQDPAARIDFPNFPFWMECQVPLSGAHRMISGAICFRATYERRPLVQRKLGEAYYRVFDRKGKWRLDFVDAQGTPLLRLLSSPSSAEETEWYLDPSHLCPTGQCRAGNDPPSARRSSPSCCEACAQELAFWQRWSNTLLALALHQPRIRSVPRSAPGAPSVVAPVPQKTVHATRMISAVSRQSRPEGATSSDSQPQELSAAPAPATAAEVFASPSARSPVMVTQSLLIERYIHRQRTQQQQDQIEQAHKFLWMHSAWAMTEALLPGVGDAALLYLPRNPVYIEFEQPRQFASMQIAACSLLCQHADEQTKQSHWRYTLIADNGTASQTLFYAFDGRKQQGRWSLPPHYTCPKNQCHSREMPSGQMFILCPDCQRRFDFVTAWLAIALRMVAGDFQEQVEFRLPEEVLETSKRMVRDETRGEMKEKTILHRFRVIHYYDACVQRSTNPQSPRGSWMSGRPLAESEYDVNPHAIIYVQIEPRDYERTYRHERFVHMRGKSQHIDPKVRLQPMTIATFRQLPHRQRITKVYASSFEE
jgi:hypothetical protein